MGYSAGKCPFFFGVFSLSSFQRRHWWQWWRELSQATLLKALLYLKLAVHNVIPLALANLTKSVLTSMGEQGLLLRHQLQIEKCLFHQPLWPQNWSGRRFLIHRCQCKQGHYLGRKHTIRISWEPQKGTPKVSILLWSELNVFLFV